MSNRRGNSGDGPSPRKPKVPLPVVSRSEGRLRRDEVDEQANSSTRTARGRTSTISRPVSRGRQGESASLRRFLILSALGLALAVSLGGFIVYVFGRPGNVPLVARLSTSESPNVLGEQPASTLFQSQKDEFSRTGSQPSKGSSFRFIKIEDASVLESKIPKAGGRNGNVVIFYFNGIVTIDSNKSDSVQLWFDDISFSTSSRDRTAVDLKTLLSEISKNLSSSAHALVILDVAPPTVTTNLGDLEFPADAIKRIFMMEDVNNKRLSVLLPCNHGEESWIAPELGSSVFGHFAAEGIETGFGNRELTIETYAEEVKNKVSGWVGSNRYATQSPLLLTPEDVDYSKFKLFSYFFNPPPATPPNPVKYESRTKDIGDLWNKFDQLKGYRWLDPVLYGSIESQLLILEDVAETNGDSWKERLKQINKSFEELRSRWQPIHRPSLIETRFYHQLGLETKTSFSNKSLQGTLEGDLDLSGNSRDDIALRLWNAWHVVAKKDEASAWQKEFSSNTMKERLNALGEPTKQIEWLEIQFGRILCDASSSNDDDSRAGAVAKLIRAFGDLQSIATTTEAFGTRETRPTRVPWERTRLMQDDFNKIEERFLESVDYFIVQDYKKAIGELDPLLVDIETLRTKANQIDEAIEFRDRVLYEAPHLMAFLVRKHRYTSIDQKSIDGATPEWLDKFKEIKRMFDTAKDIEKKLEKTSVAFLPPVKLENWDRLIDRELSDKMLEIGWGEDSKTIRIYRAALRSTFVTTAARQDWHNKLTTDFQKTNDTKEGDTTQVTNSKVFELPSELKEELGALLFRLSERNIFKAMENPSRSELFYLTRFYEKPASSESGSDKRGVLRDELASQENDFLAWQQSRNYLNRFGAGELPDDPEGYYFRTVAMTYRTPSFIPEQSPSLPVDSDQDWIPTKNAFVELRKSKPQEVSDNETTIMIQDSQLWKTGSPKGIRVGVADYGKKPEDAILGESNSAVLKKLSVRNEESRQTDSYRLLLRGHILSMSPAEKKAPSFKSEFKNDTKPATIIVQTKPKTQAIAILLDCSNSMNYAPNTQTYFDQAIDSLDSMLSAIVPSKTDKIINQTEVLLIPFGLKIAIGDNEQNTSIPTGFEIAQKGETKLSGPNGEAVLIDSEGFRLIDSLDKKDELRQLMQSLKPNGSTPLYDAIVVGLRSLESHKHNRNGKLFDEKKLIILSDGANYNPRSENSKGYAPSSLADVSKLFREIGTDVDLHVFQVDNEDWLQQVVREKNFPKETADELANENRAFFDWVNQAENRDEIDQTPFDDFRKLKDRITSTFTPPTIFLTEINLPDRKEAGSKTVSFGEKYSIAQRGQQSLTVRQPNSNKETKLDLVIRGGETLKVDYDDQLNKLSLIAAKPLGLALKTENALKPDEQWSISKRKGINEITFLVRRNEKNYTSSGTIKQIVQPATCLAKVTDPSGISYALADYKVEEDYPPTLGFPLKLEKTSKAVRFDLWYCDNIERLPGSKFIVPVSEENVAPPKDEVIGASIKRDANGKITVFIPRSSKDDRVFVICKEASETSREITGLMEPDVTELSEKHVFTVAKEVTEPTVYIVKESQLNAGSEIGHVYNVDVLLN